MSDFVYEDTGAPAPDPEPGDEYLVQVQQIINDVPIRWHRVMFWDHRRGWHCEDGGEIIFVHPTQKSVRWIKIADITLKGWTCTKVRWNEIKGEFSMDDLRSLQQSWRTLT